MAFRAKDYIKGWKSLAHEIKENAAWKCELCGVAHGSTLMGKTYNRPYTVILSVAHMNHDASDNRKENLRALCQECHTHHDRFQHATNARKTHYRKIREAMLAAGQLEMFTEEAS